MSECPICGDCGDGRPVVHRRTADAIVRCRACGSGFAHPRPTEDELRQMYEREYYPEEGLHPKAAAQCDADCLHMAVLTLVRRRYPHAVGAGARLLDFGCGIGGFIKAAQSQGITVTGIEPSPQAARHAAESVGSASVIVGGEAAVAALPDGAYDLVTAFSVLEHLRHPLAAARMLARKLAPGGVMMVAVPNMRCWRYFVERGRWFNVTNPTHLNFFSIRALAGLMRAAGLGEVRRCVYWGGRPGFGFAANVAQLLMRQLNLGSEVRLIARKPR